MTKVLVLYYSMYGHIETMAKAVAEGARSVEGASRHQARARSDAGRRSAQGRRQAGSGGADRYGGRVAGLRRHHLRHADPFRQHVRADAQFSRPDRQVVGERNLIGKVGSVFTSTATQHGGQETTITSFHSTLLHHGMIIVGVPYSCQEIMNMSEITGGSPYGAGTLAGADGSRQPSENEMKIARFQGAHVAKVAKKQSA